MQEAEQDVVDQRKTPIRPRGFAPDSSLEPLESPGERLRKLPSGKMPFSSSEKGSSPQTESHPPAPAPVENSPPDPKSARGSRRKKSKPPSTGFRAGSLALACLIASIASGAVFFALGRHLGPAKSAEADLGDIAVPDSRPTELQKREFETALGLLQNGMLSEAKNTLSSLMDQNAPITSLPLMVANAALLDGDVPLAERGIRLSIERGQSVSDALVLQAIIEAKLATTPEHKVMGNPRIRIEGLLEQAIAADSSNARPYFELATLRRFENRDDDALDLLKSAANRLGQSDSILSVNLAIELVKLERLPDGELAQAVPAGSDPQSLLCAAYAAARLGQTDKAAGLVEQARTLTPPKTFFQLLKDPAFSSWRKEPALEKFFPKNKTQ